MRILFTFLFFSFIVVMPLKSQYMVHEIGFHAGFAIIRSDYSNGDIFMDIYNLSTLNLSFTHTLLFFNKNSRWNYDSKIWGHIALRSELNFVTKHNLKHFGSFGEISLFREMTGTTSILNLGFQVEYYLKPLKEFLYPYSDSKWNPYVLAGIQYGIYNNTLHSSLGDWTQNVSLLPSQWQPSNATDVGRGGTMAYTFGGGFRRNISPKIDLNIQSNFQYFFSDSLDGLDANVVANKANDLLMNFQVGIIYQLNYNSPLKLF